MTFLSANKLMSHDNLKYSYVIKFLYFRSVSWTLSSIKSYRIKSANNCVLTLICNQSEKQMYRSTISNIRYEELIHTSFLLLICQCCNCSRGLFQRLPLPDSGKRPSTSIDSFKSSSSRTSISFIADKCVQSRGLHRPKSESFIWPCWSNKRLSGFISLK